MSDSPVAVEHHGPELRHHFATAEQQRDAASLGMWLFLGTEIMFFGGMFCAYLVYRLWYFNEFAAGSRSLDIWLGTINTIVLICSSLTVALGVRAAQMGKRTLLIVLLILTLIFGVAFLGIKGVEWYAKYKEHHIPGASFDAERSGSRLPADSHRPVARADLFLAVLRHDWFACAAHDYRCGNLLVSALSRCKGRYGPQYYTPVEMGGLYWHFVDVVWIYLFPLLYLIDRKPLG